MLDFPRPAAQTFAGDAVPARVATADGVAGLEGLGRSAGGCTLFQLVVCVWAVLLCRHAGQEEVVVGSPYHGRDAAGSEALIGYFVNVLALRIDASRTPITNDDTVPPRGASMRSASMFTK